MKAVLHVARRSSPSPAHFPFSTTGWIYPGAKLLYSFYSTRPQANTQSAVLLEESTVKDVAAVKTIPLGKSHCKLVFAPIVIGPIRASVTAAPVLPAPMVMLCAPAPLLMLRWSTIMDLPATAALTSSQPEASAEVAFIMNPKAPGCGVVIVIAIVLSL